MPVLDRHSGGRGKPFGVIKRAAFCDCRTSLFAGKSRMKRRIQKQNAHFVDHITPFFGRRDAMLASELLPELVAERSEQPEPGPALTPRANTTPSTSWDQTPKRLRSSE